MIEVKYRQLDEDDGKAIDDHATNVDLRKNSEYRNVASEDLGQTLTNPSGFLTKMMCLPSP